MWSHPFGWELRLEVDGRGLQMSSVVRSYQEPRCDWHLGAPPAPGRVLPEHRDGGATHASCVCGPAGREDLMTKGESAR